MVLLFNRCTLNEEVSLPLNESISIFSLDNFYEENIILANTIDSIYNIMSPADRYSQLIISSMGAGTNKYNQLRDEAKNNSIGGAVFLGKNTNLIDKTSQLQNDSKWPLLFSLDAEPSLINKRLTDLDQSFNKTSEAKNVEEVINVSMEIAGILQSQGIHQNYSPVSDLAINKSIINKRSYGSDIEDVKSKTNAFIIEHQSSGIIATAKHFPGHGNAKGDSHKKLVSIDELNEELQTFKSNISNNVISIMIGHIAVKGGGYSTDGKPASLSHKVITQLLKNKLNFKGVVVTDAMNMQGVTNFKDADLRALESGVDLVLMPKDPQELILLIQQKIKHSEDFKYQIETSIKKIIRLKLCLGLYTQKHIARNS